MPPDDESKHPNVDREWERMRHALKSEAPRALVHAKKHIEHLASLSRKYS